MLKLQDAETTTQAPGTHLAPSGLRRGFCLDSSGFHRLIPAAKLPRGSEKLPVARRVCVGVFAWAPQGFTAISLPRRSCVPWRSWPEWRCPQPSSPTRMAKPGCSRVTAGSPQGFLSTRRPGFVSVSWCYLLIQDFTCSFTQRFLFLTNRKGRVSWIISAVVCLAAGKRSGKKGDGGFPRFPQGNPKELLACSLLNHWFTFFV